MDNQTVRHHEAHSRGADNAGAGCAAGEGVVVAFSDKLRHLRNQRQLSQQDLRDCLKSMYPKARFSQTSISALEQRVRPPNERVLAMLSDFFGVPETYWFDGDIMAAHATRLETITLRLSGLYREYKDDLPEYAREQLRDLIGKLHVELLDGGDE